MSAKVSIHCAFLPTVRIVAFGGDNPFLSIQLYTPEGGVAFMVPTAPLGGAWRTMAEQWARQVEAAVASPGVVA